MSLFKLLFSTQRRTRLCFLFIIGITLIFAYLFTTSVILNSPFPRSTTTNTRIHRSKSSDKSELKSFYDDENIQYCYYDSSSILENISEKWDPIFSGCRGYSREIFYSENGFILVNVTVLELERLSIKRCIFRSIEWQTDYSYTIGKPIIITNFDDPSEFNLVISDFVHINCNLDSLKFTDLGSKTIYTNEKISEISDGNVNSYESINLDIENEFASENDKQSLTYEQFLVQVVEEDDTIEKLKPLMEIKSQSSINVLIIVIDSLSQTSFNLNFKKTFKAFENPVVLHGFNVAGDSVMATLLPMLTGLTDEELFEFKRNGDGGQYVGALPFIWNRFEERGYVTLYAEDDSDSGTFQHHFMGFEERPVDHYMRPFWLAVESKEFQNDDDDDDNCLGPKLKHRYILDYVTSFFNNYKQNPKFALAFIRNFDESPDLDTDLQDFINSLKADGTLNNTLVVLIGDHGTSRDQYRSTIEGMLNERMSIAILSVPRTLRSKKFGALENLEENKNKLTTPFDIHATLLSLVDPLGLKEQRKNVQGLDLFEEIPKDRICQNSGIPIHYCTCSKYEDVLDINDARVQHGANMVVNNINKIIQDGDGFEKCHKLSLEEIVSARIVIPNEVAYSIDPSLKRDWLVSNFTIDHPHPDKYFLRVILRTRPGDASFEATVALGNRKPRSQFDEKFLRPNDINRLDGYVRRRAGCIERKVPGLAKFCHCLDAEGR